MVSWHTNKSIPSCLYPRHYISLYLFLFFLKKRVGEVTQQPKERPVQHTACGLILFACHKAVPHFLLAAFINCGAANFYQIKMLLIPTDQQGINRSASFLLFSFLFFSFFPFSPLSVLSLLISIVVLQSCFLLLFFSILIQILKKKRVKTYFIIFSISCTNLVNMPQLYFTLVLIQFLINMLYFTGTTSISKIN